MIPLHLSLKNFLSYRDDAALDLKGIHLACISGANGAGKSTLLDAITWALFGKSRVKSDDDIVNRHSAASAAAAEVTFIFELEGTTYRIIRRKAAGKTTELEFHALLPAADGDRWQVRTEAKLRDTQTEIEKLLRMNYDVFTNASFLLQGKADEFTTKTPDKRKEVLADILGVSQWDQYKEVATEKRKEVDLEGASVDRQILEVETELAQEEELARALELAEIKARAITSELDRQETLVAVARHNKSLADQQRESLRRLSTELSDLEAEQSRVENLLADRRAELAAHRELLERRDAIQAAFEAWQKSSEELAKWQAKSEEHGRIQREMHPLEMNVARAQSQLEQRVRELETQREKVDEARTELAKLQSNLKLQHLSLENLQRRAAELADEEVAWQTAKTRLQELESDRKVLALELMQLESRAEQVERWEIEREQIQASRQMDVKNMEAAETELQDLIAKGPQLLDKKTELAKLSSDNKHLEIAMNEIKERLNRLESEDDQECPMCHQPLTSEHREVVIRDTLAQGKKLGDRHRENRTTMSALQAEIEAMEKAQRNQPALERKRNTHQATVGRYDNKLKDIEDHLAAWWGGDEPSRLRELQEKLADDAELNDLKDRAAQLITAASEARQLQQEQQSIGNLIARDETRLEAMQTLMLEWETKGRPELETAQQQLVSKAFAMEDRTALAELRVRLAAVAYDAELHNAIRTRLAGLATAANEHQRLMQADAAVKPLTDALEEMDRQRERAISRITKLRIQCEQSEQQLQQLEASVGDLRHAEAELQRLREEVVTAGHTVGAARQRVEVLDTRKEDRKQLATRKKTLAHRISLLKQLEEACSRKGVQALLIEEALPEIEGYANDLLDRLSGGEMHISFDTQRASKTKQDNYIETLDIKISDGAGVRPYENYSGGEKFRVNFAIRLALSQVLAHRAGARLRTLVIDEGFGSQDPEGRQRLVEAINAVQDEFACILVITHIDELRDKFPARIDVEKTVNGSRLSVVSI